MDTTALLLRADPAAYTPVGTLTHGSERGSGADVSVLCVQGSPPCLDLRSGGGLFIDVDVLFAMRRQAYSEAGPSPFVPDR